MLATGMEHGHDHQIGVAEEPLPGAGRSLRRTSLRSEVLNPRQAPQMLAADARQAGDLFLGENLLARLDSDHCLGLQLLRCFQQTNRPPYFPATVVPY